MNTFRYMAVDAAGRPVQGAVEATDWPAALALLNERGYYQCRPAVNEEQLAKFAQLNRGDALELAGYLSDAAATGVPLPAALRTLAADARSAALTGALGSLAEQLEAGLPLEGALQLISTRLPVHVRQMIVAGARSGHLAQTLDQVLAQQRVMDTLTRKFRQAVLYPAILVVFLTAWVLFVSLWIIPQMQLDDLVGEFSDSISPSAARPVEFARVAPPLIGATALLAVVLVTIVRLLAGAGGLSRLASCLPLVGRAWWYRGLAEFSGLMSVFLGQRQTLTEALRLTATAARDPAVRRAAGKLALEVTRGQSLHEGMSRQGFFSPLMVQLAAWGESRNALAEVLSACQRMYVDRFDRQAQLVRLVVPPAAFLLIAGIALFVAGSVFGLFSLITELASSSPTGRTTSFLEVPGVELSGVASVLIAGATLLFCANLLVMLASTATALSGLLRFCGLTLLAVGISASCLLVPGFWGIVGWLAVIFVWVRGAVHARAVDRRNLQSAILLSAERSLPLPPVIRAFAQEQDSGHGACARELANQLEHGMPLASAIWLTPGALPREAALAVKVGEDTGDLLGAMRAADSSPLLERTLARPVLLRLAYVLPAMLLFVLFMKIKIEPSFIKIFEDFDQPMPPFSQMVFGVPFVSHFWPSFASDALNILILLVVLTGMAVVVLSILVVLQWRGTWRPWLPVLRPIITWIDTAPLLRLMALETRHSRPLVSINTLARLHPKAAMRGRLQAIVRDLNNGASWQQSLRQRRLLGAADLAVLSAAERAGNLSWALDETADSFERRANYRLQALAQVVMPLLLLPVALLAAVMVVAYFLPLTNLIWSLS